MKRLFFLFLFGATCAYGQGAFYTAGPFSAPGLMYVCPVPSGGTPCPSPVSIFSNSALTTATANPASVSSGSAIGFWVTPGQYTIEMPASNFSQVVTIGGGSGGQASYYVPAGGTLSSYMTACNAGGGGQVYVLIPGVYSITSTINVGATVSGSLKTICTLYIGGGVNLQATAGFTTHAPIFRVFDGSAIRGLALGIQFSSSGVGSQGPQISCAASSNPYDFIEAGAQDGSQNMLSLTDFQVQAASTCSVDIAMIHLRGTANGTYFSNINSEGAMPQTGTGRIGILIDGPSNVAIVAGTNPSNITTVSGNGSTVTVTVLATQTNDPEATELSLGQTFVMSGCTGGSGTFNGTFTVASMTGATGFTYAASGNGTPTACTYAPTNTFNGTTGVMVFDNVSMNGSSLTGQKPVVITDSSTVGGTQVTDLIWNGGNFQGSDPLGGLKGGSGCVPNSSGTLSNNPCWGNFTIDGLNGSAIQDITLNRVHVEAGGNAGTTGIYLRDTNNITINGPTAAASGGDVIDISATTPSKIWGIRVRDLHNNNWTNDIYNANNSRTYARTAYSRAMKEYSYGVATSGSSNCEVANTAQTCDSTIYDNANIVYSPDTHVNAVSASNDFFGTVQITASTTGTRTFSKTWVSAPNCFAFPMGNPTATGAPWATTTTTVLTVNVNTSGTLLVGYICTGNLN